MVKNTVTGRVRSERGAAAVEFALVLPVLLLVVAGAVEFGRAFWFYDALSKATRDATRYISIANCFSGESASDCNTRIGGMIGEAKNIVTRAATGAGVTNFSPTNVDVRCVTSAGVSSACLTGSNVLGASYVSVAVINYGIRLGEWLPLNYSGGAAGYDLGIYPYTTMRYMGG